MLPCLTPMVVLRTPGTVTSTSASLAFAAASQLLTTPICCSCCHMAAGHAVEGLLEVNEAGQQLPVVSLGPRAATVLLRAQDKGQGLPARCCAAALRCGPVGRRPLPSAQPESRRSSSQAHSFAAWVPTAMLHRPDGSRAGALGLGMLVMSLRASELGRLPTRCRTQTLQRAAAPGRLLRSAGPMAP